MSVGRAVPSDTEEARSRPVVLLVLPSQIVDLLERRAKARGVQVPELLAQLLADEVARG